jgi:hypothetical protein
VRSTAILAAVLTSSLCGLAHSQVTIDPPSPKAFFEVRVKVKGADFGLDLSGRPDNFDARNTTVTMVGNKITVSPLMMGAPDFSASLPSPPMEQTLGALPPGTYQVEVIKRATGTGSLGQVGSTLTFTVQPRQQSEPMANYSDLWWVPSESGWGLAIFHHPSQKIFANLFIYGPDSKPVWYVLPGGSFTQPTIFEGTLYKTTGPYFGGAFTPNGVDVRPAGSAAIAFDALDLNKAAIRFTVDGVEFVKYIERLGF